MLLHGSYFYDKNIRNALTNRKSTNNNDAMNRKSTNQESIALFASITPEERDRAKSLAKSKGMTFQGFVGQLIKKELELSSNTEAANG